MPEQEGAPEIQQEALIAKIDQELQEDPTEIPEDRKGLLRLLSDKGRSYILAGLVMALGPSYALSAEAKPQTYTESAEAEKFPPTIKLSKGDLQEKFKDPNNPEQNDANRFIELANGLAEYSRERTAQEKGNVEYGVIGRNIIAQIETIMRLCDYHGIKNLDEVFDTSTIESDLLASAQGKFEETQRISKGQKQTEPIAKK